MVSRDTLMLSPGFWKLDADQAKAFESNGNTLVVAGPGSGKTRLLVAKAIRLYLQHSSRDVCIVTFSKAAVTEIEHRLVAALGSERAKRIKVGTFHALTYKMLRAYWTASRQTPPTLLTDFAGKDLMMHCITQLNSEFDIEQALQALSIAKAAPISSGEAKLASTDPKLTQLLNLYEHKRKANGAIDFSDMVREAAFGLRAGTIAPLPFKYFLVDEFQDIDPAQKSWLDYHLSKGAQATVVGDDDQAIYGFRASMGFAAMTQFCDQFQATRLNLSTNYRCALDIVEASRMVIQFSTDRFPKNIRGSATDRGEICIASEESEIVVADQVAADFAFHLDSDPQMTFAVISRTNVGLDAIEMGCARAGVPCIRIGSASLLKKEAIARRVALLTCIVQPFDKRAFLSAVHGLTITNSGKSLIADFFTNASTRHTVTETLFQAALYPTLSRDDATLLRGLRDCMVSISEDYEELTQDLNEGSPDNARVGQFITRSFDRLMTIQKETPILAFLRSVLSAYRRGTVLERLQSLDKKDSTDESKREGVVTLITAHRSKGLEFDRVWVIGCSDGVFPSSEKGDILPSARTAPKNNTGKESAGAHAINVFAEEERRLFYVSMTRAKQALTLSFVAEQGPNLYLAQLQAAAGPTPSLASFLPVSA